MTPSLKPVELPYPSDEDRHPFWLRKLAHRLGSFGPAAIAASVSIGAGETMVSVRTGAWAGYQLMWIVLLACVAKGLLTTYLIGRYTAVTGELFGHRLARLPGPRGWLPLLLIVIELGVAGLIFVVIARPCGTLIRFLVQDFIPALPAEGDVGHAPWLRTWDIRFAIAFALLAVGVSLGLSYQRLEKQNLIICGVLVAGTLLACVLVRPDFHDAARGTLVPAFPLTPWSTHDPVTGRAVPSPPGAGQYDYRYVLLLVTVFGYIGNTVFGYVVYSNWVSIRRWGLTSAGRQKAIQRHLARHGGWDYLPCSPQQIVQLRRRLAPLRWDVCMGAVVLFVVSASFMMSGAQILYPRAATGGLPGWETLLTEQRHVWREVHPWLVPVYYISMLAALWGTLNALPEVWARVTHEFLAAIDRRAEGWSYRTVKRCVALAVTVPCVLLLVTETELGLLQNVIATLTTNLAVALVCLVSLYINWSLPRPYRPHRVVLAAGAVAVGLLVVSAVGGLAGLSQRVGLF